MGVVGVVVVAVVMAGVSTVFSTFSVEDILLLLDKSVVTVVVLAGLDVLEGFKILLRASSNI